MNRARAAKAVLATTILLGAHQAAYADDTAALKQQIRQLNARIEHLEQQLAQKQHSTQTHQGTAPFWSQSPFDNDPFMEMEQMQRSMNQMFQESFAPMHNGQYRTFFNPRIDIKESSEQYTITMDIPGMDKDKIDVKVENHNLIVSGERSSENTEDKQGKTYRHERSFGHFMRVVPLPQDAKTDTVDAQYNNGVLTVKVARGKDTKPTAQKITVK